MLSPLALLLAGLPVLSAAHAVPADPTGAQQEASLAERIAAAAPGDIVAVGAGVFVGPLVIDKPLTLVGAGWESTRIGARAGHDPAVPTLTVRGEAEVVLRGLRLGASAPPAGPRVRAAESRSSSRVPPRSTRATSPSSAPWRMESSSRTEAP